MPSEEKPILTLYLPLSDRDIELLKSEEEVHRMYHVGDWRALAVLHADGLVHPSEMDRFEFMRREGVDILNVPVNESDLNQFPEKAISLKYDSERIHLLVMTEGMYKELEAEMAAKAGGLDA